MYEFFFVSFLERERAKKAHTMAAPAAEQFTIHLPSTSLATAPATTTTAQENVIVVVGGARRALIGKLCNKNNLVAQLELLLLLLPL